MCGAYNQKKDRKQILNFQKCWRNESGKSD